MGHAGLHHGGALSAERMEQLLQDRRAGLVEVHQAHGQVQRIADSGLFQEADMMLADNQSGGRMRREGASHGQRRRQAGERLCGVRDIEAHVEVSHLIALPGMDTTAPDFDPYMRHCLRPQAL